MYKHQRLKHGRVHKEKDNRFTAIRPNDDGRFQCEFCEETFYRRFKMYKHQREVHGRESESKKVKIEGKFQCDVCGNRLASTYGLKHHLKTVHNIKQ